MKKAKIENKEQETYNKERIIDINLILQYMESFDINKEYFTELGEGHLRGLASLRDELVFVSKEKYDDLEKELTELKNLWNDYKKDYKTIRDQEERTSIDNKELFERNAELFEENIRLRRQLKNKKSWF